MTPFPLRRIYFFGEPLDLGLGPVLFLIQIDCLYCQWITNNNSISWLVALLFPGLSRQPFFLSFIISDNYSKISLISSTKEGPIKLEHLNLCFRRHFTQKYIGIFWKFLPTLNLSSFGWISKVMSRELWIPYEMEAKVMSRAPPNE